MTFLSYLILYLYQILILSYDISCMSIYLVETIFITTFFIILMIDAYTWWFIQALSPHGITIFETVLLYIWGPLWVEYYFNFLLPQIEEVFLFIALLVLKLLFYLKSMLQSTFALTRAHINISKSYGLWSTSFSFALSL